jgi:isoamylase
MDYTGCGNSLNMVHPQTLKLVMDSLRYWVQEMHVDGFRFDLAATLARELHEVDRLSAFFDIIHQDPVISQVKLIAEPWDVGPGGYQVGNFPVLWAEWNGRYRDTVRAYWRGDPGTIAELGFRLTGSSDLYESDGRRPHASINFITAHDGFTLNDLVTYNEKHNWANGEENRDGENHNLSYNFGVEGPTDDPEIVRQREKQKRNFIVTLLLSQGVPMICGGRRDGAHAGREQQRVRAGQRDLLAQLGAGRSADQGCSTSPGGSRRCAVRHPVFHRRHFFQGRRIRGSELEDITWLRPDGEEMTGGGVEQRLRRIAASACGSAAMPCSSGTSRASGSSTTPSCCSSTGGQGGAGVSSRRFSTPARFG